MAGGFVTRIAKAVRHASRSKNDAARAKFGPAIFDKVFDTALLDDEHFILIHVVMQRRPAAGRHLVETERERSARVGGSEFEVYVFPEGAYDGASIFRNNNRFVGDSLFHHLTKVSAAAVSFLIETERARTAAALRAFDFGFMRGRIASN